MNAIWITLAVALLIVILVAVSYNRFATQTALMENSWANVDTELRRRHDLVPNLVETVQGYAGHERTHARAGGRRTFVGACRHGRGRRAQSG